MVERKRIRLSTTPHDDNAANVWADVDAAPDSPDEIGVLLLHDYPDLTPAVGWWLECEGKEYEVVALGEHEPKKRMTCRLKGGA